MLRTSHFCVWVLLFLFALPVSAFAQLEFKAGPEVYYFKYKEPEIMKETGVMKGITGACSYTHKDKMLELNGRYASGTVDYDSESTGFMDNIDNYTTEWRILGGTGFELTESTAITAYAGWGFRKLIDDAVGRTSSTGNFFYRRESTYQYSPIGVRINSDLDNNWSMGAILEYDIFWRGTQKNNYGDANPSYKNTAHIQKEGHGARVSINLAKRFKNFSLGITPFIRSWFVENSSFADSGAEGYLMEPGNRTLEIGANFNIGF